MVVVAVIGILSAIVFANFGDSRKIARDNVRKTDLKDLQVAIELYKAQNGHYPDGCRGNNTWSGGTNSTFVCPTTPVVPNCTDYICGLVPDYIAELPTDPNPATTGNNGYVYRSYGGVGTATEYKLLANNTVEKLLITSYDDEFARCPSTAVDVTTNCPSGTWPGTTSLPKTYAVYKGTKAQAQGW